MQNSSFLNADFHLGPQVYGIEYSFGWNNADETGVFECPERQNGKICQGQGFLFERAFSGSHSVM